MILSYILYNTAELERTVLYKTGTVEIVHYEDETNWHALENKGPYLVKNIEFSLVCTFARSV